MTTTVFHRLDDPNDHLCGLDHPPRMQVLASIDLDNPHLRRELDVVAERTAQRLGLRVALVTLVLDTAQICAGSYGVPEQIATGGIPVEWSMCAHAVATRRAYIVPDAAVDPVQAGNPGVAMAGIAGYAGVPLIMDDQALGGHCVITPTPRSFTDAEVRQLHAGATDIVEVLRQYRLPLDAGRNCLPV